MKLDEAALQLVKRLTERGETIAAAESCTGGMTAQKLTAVPGSSNVFECGIIAYAERIKVKALGVSAETLARFGAVSPQTAEEMARGVRAAAGSDWGISTTGFAGPSGGNAENPVGTVYIAAVSQNECAGERLSLWESCGGDRERIREEAAHRALALALRLLDNR